MKQLTAYIFHIIFAAIIVLATGLQLFRLNSAPGGGLVDEPAFGYSAYSMLTDLKDEHDVFLPLVFESYGDQKMPLYVYILVPFIKILGLTDAAVRLPAVLSAIVLIPLAYILLRQCGVSKWGAVTTCAVFAFSPFAFMMGRIGRESTLGLVFYILALITFFHALKTKKYLYIILSVICFAGSWYSYVAYRFVTIFTLPVLYGVSLWKNQLPFKQAIIAAFAFILLIIPSATAGSILTARVNQVGIFADKGAALEITEKRQYCAQNNGGVLCRINANKGVVYGRRIISEWIQAFSPQYLFLTGDKELFVQNVENYGQFSLFTLPLYYLGLFAYFRNRKEYNQTHWYIFLLIIPLAVLPAVIAGLHQKMRTAPFVFLSLIPIAFGLDYALNTVRSYTNHYKVISALILTFLIFVSTIIFQLDFHTVHISKYSTLYNAQLTPLMKFLKQYEDKTPVYIATFSSDPIMFYAFYNQVSPVDYRKNVTYFDRDGGGFKHAQSYKQIRIQDIDPQTIQEKRFLYVTDKKLPYKQIYVGKTENKVHELVYVYEIEKN